MASRTVPGIGLLAEWDFRETAWKAGMDENLRRLSLLVQMRVHSFVTVLPSGAAQGQRHILVDAGSPYNNHLAVWDQGMWVYYAPEPNALCINMQTNVIHMYVTAFGGWAEMTSPGAIKDIYESNPNTNAFTDTLLTKLNGIEDGAKAAMSDTDIKIAYERNINTNEFSDAEKAKLAGLSASRFLGTYVSLTALRAAHPSPPSGSFAYVDSGTNADIMSYIWDATDLKYVPQASGNTQETPESIKAKYEANDDTNAFTDAEKLKLEAYDPDAPSLPVGGTAGQLLTKSGPADGQAEWADPAPALPEGGTAGQLLVKQSVADGDAAWVDPVVVENELPPTEGEAGKLLSVDDEGNPIWIPIPEPEAGVPDGGLTGQVLMKLSNTDGDAAWRNVDGTEGVQAVYWRIRILNVTTSNPFIRLGELQFLDLDKNPITGGTNIAGVGTPNNAFDGSLSTYWDSGVIGSGSWLGKNYGTGNPKGVAYVRIYPVTSEGNLLSNFAIEYSDDGVTYQTAYTHTQDRPDLVVATWTEIQLEGFGEIAIPAIQNNQNRILSVKPDGTGIEWQPPFKRSFGAKIAAAQRWRYVVMSNVGNTNTCLTEIEMRETPEGPNLCDGGTVTSSGMNSGNPASLFDGSISGNIWIAGSTNVWVEYQFLSAVSINHLRVYSQSGQASGWPITYKLQFFDGSAWIDAYGGSTNFTGAGQNREYTNPLYLPEGGSVFPYLAGHAGKMLVVNSDEQGASWQNSILAKIENQTASLTLDASYAGKYLRFDNTSEVEAVITIPDLIVGGFQIGQSLMLRRGAGPLRVAPVAGITVNTPETLQLRKTHSTATLVRVGVSEWDLIGDLRLIE